MSNSRKGQLPILFSTELEADLPSSRWITPARGRSVTRAAPTIDATGVGRGRRRNLPGRVAAIVELLGK